MLAGLTHAPVVELSERLAALTGLGHAFYASDGASATEIALKMSAHHWRNAGKPAKNRFVALQGGYHGETAGRAGRHRHRAVPRGLRAAGAAVGHGAVARRARRAGRRDRRRRRAARRARRSRPGWPQHHEETAAFIVEPLVQCATGMAMHDPAYLREARALCDRFGVHLVRRRDRRRLRPHRHDVRAPAGRHPARLHLPVQGPDRRHAAAGRGAHHRRRLRRASTTTTPRAASCTRTRTPATRSRAARRWPRWTSSSARTCSPSTSSAPA